VRQPARVSYAARLVNTSSRCVSAQPNILLIPGTSSVAHLRENITGAALALSADDLVELDTIGR
jgi:pyridoxine 4-dehydrogenase